MSLGNEIFEWRKQMVEKLLLNGVGPEDLEQQVNSAEMAIFGGCAANLKIECSVRHVKELVATLNDFATKNGCAVDIIECE